MNMNNNLMYNYQILETILFITLFWINKNTSNLTLTDPSYSLPFAYNTLVWVLLKKL